MGKILVAGGAGFIGYHLARYLSKNSSYEIHIADNLSRGKLDSDLKELLSHENIRFIEADLTNPDLYDLLDADYDYVYGLAGLVGVKNVTENPEKTLHVNIFSILNLLRWLKNTNKNLKKLIFASTSEVYAGTFKHYEAPVPTDENINLTLDDVTSPRTTYAISKMVGESACFSYYSKYKIPFTIVRYHNVYGPRMGSDHVIPELLLRAKAAREDLGVYSVGHKRAFCYINDAVRATVRLAEEPDSLGQIFNVGNSNEEISIGELAKKIINIVNPILKIKPLGDQNQSTLRRCPDTTKLKKTIHFEPKIFLEEGIQLTWEWYKDVKDQILKVI